MVSFLQRSQVQLTSGAKRRVYGGGPYVLPSRPMFTGRRTRTTSENFASLEDLYVAWPLGALLGPLPGVSSAGPQGLEPSPHTDPLNLDPVVREGYERFYILDYEGALGRFESALKAHPNEPMASNYVLMATIFRELYHQDLLDTRTTRTTRF